jgi:hypothetical protein
MIATAFKRFQAVCTVIDGRGFLFALPACYFRDRRGIDAILMKTAATSCIERLPPSRSAERSP